MIIKARVKRGDIEHVVSIEEPNLKEDNEQLIRIYKEKHFFQILADKFPTEARLEYLENINKFKECKTKEDLFKLDKEQRRLLKLPQTTLKKEEIIYEFK